MLLLAPHGDEKRCMRDARQNRQGAECTHSVCVFTVARVRALRRRHRNKIDLIDSLIARKYRFLTVQPDFLTHIPHTSKAAAAAEEQMLRVSSYAPTVPAAVLHCVGGVCHFVERLHQE